MASGSTAGSKCAQFAFKRSHGAFYAAVAPGFLMAGTLCEAMIFHSIELTGDLSMRCVVVARKAPKGRQSQLRFPPR